MTTSLQPSILCQSPLVSIIGAGNVGSTLAQRIVEKNLANVVLLDVVEGRPQGVALDLLSTRGLEGHHRFITGTTDYAETANSDVVVITAGLPRKPGMSRDDLLKINAKIVIEATQKAIAYSPNALFILVTNPLDVMTYLAWKVSGLPPMRVMGMAGILDSARFRTFVAMELGISPVDVCAMVLGSHGDLMVPLPRYCTINGIPLTELISEERIHQLVERTRNGGAEIVQLMKTGGAYYAPASSICVMVEAVLLNQPRLLPIAAHLQGEYGLNDIYIGVPVRLGCRGIEDIVELDLSATERAALHRSAEAVRQNVDRVLPMLQDS